MKKLILLIFGILFLLNSCKNDDFDNDSKEDDVSEKTEQDNIEKLNKQYISTDFNDNSTFNSQTEKDLLAEIKICDLDQTDTENFINPACDPKFFRVFPLSDKLNIKDAFLVIVKSKVHDFPIRRVIVFTRENGELIQANRFMGNLIAMRDSETGYKDVVIRFRDEEENYFNCLYQWKDKRYQFKKVEQINESNVKPEFQEKMNVEIPKEIERMKLSI